MGADDQAHKQDSPKTYLYLNLEGQQVLTLSQTLSVVAFLIPAKTSLLCVVSVCICSRNTSIREKDFFFYLAGWVELFNPFRTLNTHMHSKASLMVNKHHSEPSLVFFAWTSESFCITTSLGNKTKASSTAAAGEEAEKFKRTC